MSKQKSEGNRYDKIFKENASATFIPLIEEQLGIKIKSYEPLEAKMQRTREVEMDFFYKVQPESGESFILHLEFQVEDDHDMVYRMAEYWAMAGRKWRLDVEQFVIFMGETPSSMQHQLKKPYTGFRLINICEFSSEEMLTSQVPELIILSILGDLPPEQAESHLRKTIEQLTIFSKSQNARSSYFNQLLVLSNLRNLEPIILKIIKDMPTIFNIETSQVYKLGTKKGEAIGEKRGEKRGEKTGEKRGEVGKDLKIIYRRIALGFDISTLVAITDFSEKEIMAIESALKKPDISTLAKITKISEQDIQMILDELNQDR